MLRQKYQLDDELRVVRTPDGSEQVGVRRTVSAPSEALAGHIEAVKEYEQILGQLKERFVDAVGNHREQINSKLSHARFFNKEFGGNRWGYNREFDQLRLKYITLEDSLERELRGLDMKEIEGLKSLARDLRDARSEVSPFKNFLQK
jgi:hypothetical protein